MDLLTDLLQRSGLRRRLLNQRQIAPGSAVRFPCDKSLGLHVVMSGSVYVQASSLKQPLQLQAGDIALMARGCEHLVSAEAVVSRKTLVTVAAPWTNADEEPTARADDTSTASSAVISGAYQFWHTPVHPFFGEIPDWFVLRAASLPRLAPLSLSLSLLADEVHQRQLGSDVVVHGLLDVIFTCALRELVRQRGSDRGIDGSSAASWSHAINDPQVRQVVALMHGDCAHAWTLDELASRAGLSRTSLAERFRLAMGDTPLAHLRTLRMQRAMQVLSDSERTLEQVAQEVGYTDAFSFSKVFKRTVGVAPREFRQQDRHDKTLPWRFQAG